MNTGEVIKLLRKRKNLTQEQLGDLIGVQKSAIAKYEKGRVENLKRSTIEKLAEIFSVSPSYILGIDNDETIYRSAGLDFVRIPLYGPLCCGNGGFVDDNIIEYIPVPSKGLNKPEDCFCQIAIGESMKDAGINTGDLLVFEKSLRVEIGVIGCFCIDENEATCKKYNEVNGIIMLQPMNSDFEPIIVDTMSTSFRCLGKLKKVIKDFE